jgi:hypothetical protein
MNTTLIQSEVAGQHVSQGTGQGASSREYLTFRLGREEYGIDILRGQEILNKRNSRRSVVFNHGNVARQEQFEGVPCEVNN